MESYKYTFDDLVRMQRENNFKDHLGYDNNRNISIMHREMNEFVILSLPVLKCSKWNFLLER